MEERYVNRAKLTLSMYKEKVCRYGKSLANYSFCVGSGLLCNIELTIIIKLFPQ